MIKTTIKTSGLVLALLIAVLNTGCNDYLDVTPPSEVSPEDYLVEESQLAAYTINYYANYTDPYNKDSDNKGGMFPSHYGSGGESPYWDDMHTDNQMNKGGSNRYLINGMDGEWQVGEKDGKWNFTNIYALNFYLNTVVPRHQEGEITGSSANIDHYIGEGYFLRAQEYFFRVKKLGDFPIVTEVLPDDLETLSEASVRQPRNEVARFILEDLDKAISLLQESGPGSTGKNRITRNAALLLKARVALFEATWLKYHKGTALVPNGSGWPGAEKEATKNYQFPTGSIDGEIDYFLTQAMEASKQVADLLSLTANNSSDIAANSYYNLFTDTDLDNYEEVILWRAYSSTYSVFHSYNHWNYGGNTSGFTKQFEKTFLMENGLPVYASGSNYQGDDHIADTKLSRDNRWQLFMKAPGELRKPFTEAIFPELPTIYDSGRNATATGYILGKGYSLTEGMDDLGRDQTAFPIYRAVEAYLIYIEACYEKNGTIDATADGYWRAIRSRAGVDTDYTKTIAATNMSVEAQNDWAAYSHGTLVDATLYNIRRERRCEFIGEGFRYDDLIRWRAMDQLDGYILEGFKVSTLYDQYTETQKENIIYEPGVSDYVRPNKSGNYANGFYFTEAHYLDPIAVKHFQITAPDGASVAQSVIYQNPGWPIEAGAGNIQ